MGRRSTQHCVCGVAFILKKVSGSRLDETLAPLTNAAAAAVGAEEGAEGHTCTRSYNAGTQDYVPLSLQVDCVRAKDRCVQLHLRTAQALAAETQVTQGSPPCGVLDADLGQLTSIDLSPSDKGRRLI